MAVMELKYLISPKTGIGLDEEVTCNYMQCEEPGVYNFYKYVGEQHAIIFSISIEDVKSIKFMGVV